ncbi:MAG: cobalt-precorrin-5B (C(1))-methyltransferase [Desulfohalobiaceae bacterium]
MSRSDDRIGVSTGSCSAAAAKAAFFVLAGADVPQSMDISLPDGKRLTVQVDGANWDNGEGVAEVVKDAGSDPDVTHRARIRARLRFLPDGGNGEVELVGGSGVGRVTQPGLPVAVGEAAINPEPRRQIREAVVEAMRETGFSSGVEVILEVDRGQELAQRTMNPRLGIVDGVSILGTRGTVLPYSKESYRETIRMGLDVASTKGLREIALSTGGRSERLLAAHLPDLPEHGFVQIADFFAFSLEQAVARDFRVISLSVFWGKLVKMAQGHSYTHAKVSRIDFSLLADWCLQAGVDDSLAREVEQANTARHALQILDQSPYRDGVVADVARRAREQAEAFAGENAAIAYYVFDFDGGLLYRSGEKVKSQK